MSGVHILLAEIQADFIELAADDILRQQTTFNPDVTITAPVTCGLSRWRGFCLHIGSPGMLIHTPDRYLAF